MPRPAVDLSTPNPEAMESLRRIAAQMVNRFHRKAPDIDREDLLSAAWLALYRAKHNYTNRRGVRFNVYATAMMNGALLEHCRTSSGIKRRQWQRVKAGEYSVESLFPLSLNVILAAEDPDDELGERILDPSPGPLALLLERAEAWRVDAAVNRLPEHEELVVRLHFWEGLTYLQIRAETGFSKKAVSKLIHSALARLREWLSD